MVDSAKDYNRLVKEEDQKFRHRVPDYQSQLPQYSPQAQELTREQEKADYQETKLTLGGFDARLEEEAAKFGLVKAVDDILDWAIRNERA